MQKEISSSSTFSFKVLFPCFWILGSGFMVLNSSFNGARVDWLLLLNWVGAFIFLIWFSYRLKSVRIDGDLLFIKNYRKEISTPLSNITDVSESYWGDPKTIKLVFRDATEFGEQISFLGQEFHFAFWRSHPVVHELRKLAKLDEAGT